MCGVFGVLGHPEAARITYLGLHALQHRGQESAGIVTLDAENRMTDCRGLGLVADVFNRDRLDRLAGTTAVGHVRYSTAGGTSARATQPFAVETMRGPIGLAHNGNLVNATELRRELERDGAIFATRSDTEVFVHLLARARAPRIEDRLREAAAQVTGAYTVVVSHKDGLTGLRDPSGFRPLILGRVGRAYAFASETTALDLVEGEPIREVEPGEMVTVRGDHVSSERLLHEPDARTRACIFELVYFARPDSRIFGRSVFDARYALGAQLAREAPAKADLVVPVPDSGVPAALGFAETAGLPFRHGLIRSHYVGRTFIEPEAEIRNFGVRLKLSAVRSVLEGKRIIVVDDSLVRGTTSRKIVGMLRGAGAREVHLRVSCPPTRFPCYYGIDTPTREELIAAEQDVESIRDFVTADSLAYVSTSGLHHSVGDVIDEGRQFCNACFTGRYSSGLETIRTRLPML